MTTATEELIPRALPEHVDRARKFLAEEGTRVALQGVSALLPERPSDPDLLAVSLICQLWSGDMDGALKESKRLLSTSKTAGLLAATATIESFAGEKSAAEKHLVEAESIDSEHFLVLRQRADSLVMEGHIEAATAISRRYLQLYPEDWSAYSSLVTAALGSGREAEALALLDQAPAWYRNSPEYLYKLGAMRLKEHRLDEAEALMRDAVAMNSDSASYWAYLSLVLKAQKKMEEAERAAGFALEINTRQMLACQTMVSVCESRGDYKGAQSWSTRAKESVPALVQQQLMKESNQLIAAGKRPQAIKVLQKLIANGPALSETAARRMLIRCYLDNEQPKEAARELDLARSKGDESSDVEVGEFRVLLATDLDAAGKRAEALSKSPFWTEASPYVIEYFSKQRDVERMQEITDRLIAEVPGLPASLAGAVMALLNAKQTELARRLHEVAYRKYPNDNTLKLLSAGMDADRRDLASAARTLQTLPPHMRPRISFRKLFFSRRFWTAVVKAFLKSKRRR